MSIQALGRREAAVYALRSELRATLMSAVRHHPVLERTAAALFRTAVRARSKQVGLWRDPFQLAWIDPRRITRTLNGILDRTADTGKILPGDWDLEATPLTSWNLYQAFEDRFIRGRRWEDTEYYQQILYLTYHRRTPWTRWKNKDEFDERTRYWDGLFENIRHHGYKTQGELDPRHRFRLGFDDEVAVRIDRHGRPLVESGVHRLVIAQILGLASIPVCVTARHLDWFALGQALRAWAGENGWPEPLPHFDLAGLSDVPADRTAEVLRSRLPTTARSILVVRAGLGYLCHELEANGFDCRTIEGNPAEYRFLTKLKAAAERHFLAVENDLQAITTDDLDAVVFRGEWERSIGGPGKAGVLIRQLRSLNRGPVGAPSSRRPLPAVFHVPEAMGRPRSGQGNVSDDSVPDRRLAENLGAAGWEIVARDANRSVYQLRG